MESSKRKTSCSSFASTIQRFVGSDKTIPCSSWPKALQVQTSASRRPLGAAWARCAAHVLTPRTIVGKVDAQQRGVAAPLTCWMKRGAKAGRSGLPSFQPGGRWGRRRDHATAIGLSGPAWRASGRQRHWRTPRPPRHYGCRGRTPRFSVWAAPSRPILWPGWCGEGLAQAALGASASATGCELATNWRTIGCPSPRRGGVDRSGRDLPGYGANRRTCKPASSGRRG